VAAEAGRRGVTLQLELSSCQVETTSSVAATSAQLGQELTRLRRTAAQAAEAAGVRLLALGLAPIAGVVGQFGHIPQRRERLRELAQHPVDALAGRRSAAVLHLTRGVRPCGAHASGHRGDSG
jgi:gamma-glutamyl:cysteine ligase YbdK (ATP-grasp superfamily)